MIRQEIIEEAYSYCEYRSLLIDLLEMGKTTGNNQSENMLHYAKLNEARMKRLDKTIVLEESTREAIREIKSPQIWLTLTEGWCGDAAQNLPIINKIAEENYLIEFKLILRDEHTEIMDLYLTDGGRSIPKIIMMDKDSLTELGTWGPRPAPIQARVMENKQTGKKTYDEMNRETQLWYTKDKTLTAQSEFRTLLASAQNKIAL